MRIDLIRFLISAILSVASWSTPQPKLSSGLLVVYGNQYLVEANADWHGYNLTDVPERCGLSAISPAHLGQLAYVRVDGHDWVGPCVVVDAVSRKDAYESIYDRHEIAEISRQTAAELGFAYGGPGYIWFGPCPPILELPRAYRPSMTLDYQPYDYTPSFYPYSKQIETAKCGHTQKAHGDAN